ncbi:MAG: TIGR02281 family clan AA aspartic protease, partial [Hyphomicrobiales bacterium]
VFLIFAGLAPMVPDLLEKHIGKTEPGASKPIRVEKSAGDRMHLVSADRRGQFVADVELNGRSVEMLVDTGATATALPVSVAEMVGIFPKGKDFKYRIGTANGVTLGARATIDRLKIGAIYLRDIEAIVLRDKSLREPLLGMSALNQLDRFDISDGTLVLVQ